ncbi:hypothetical protein [Halosimplex halophilum]|uniref:hypothetical protein n=1 Tax=Halosimplex halophilum TaxID=2559572 RepID=UPI00107F2969|nr:hypothetical protein [Halosimplex halophilum]
MKRTLIAVGLATLVALAGCSALTGGSGDGDPTTVTGEQVALEDDSAGATDVNQTLRLTVDETTNGSEWTAIGATYPRENFTVDSAQHGEIVLGVDTDDDGELEREFDEGSVSGVNNNAYSFDVTLDTDYTLSEGDVVVVGYPAVDNPDEPGDYEVDVRVNDEQNAAATVTIE